MFAAESYRERRRFRRGQVMVVCCAFALAAALALTRAGTAETLARILGPH